MLPRREGRYRLVALANTYPNADTGFVAARGGSPTNSGSVAATPTTRGPLRAHAGRPSSVHRAPPRRRGGRLFGRTTTQAPGARRGLAREASASTERCEISELPFACRPRPTCCPSVHRAPPRRGYGAERRTRVGARRGWPGGDWHPRRHHETSENAVRVSRCGTPPRPAPTSTLSGLTYVERTGTANRSEARPPHGRGQKGGRSPSSEERRSYWAQPARSLPGMR